MAPGVNDQEKEEDETETQQDNRPGLTLPKLPERSGHFSKIHAEPNLHQFGHKQKGHGAISLASTSPVEGPLLQGIEVADKQDHQEGNHRAEYCPPVFFQHVPVYDRPGIKKDHFDIEVVFLYPWAVIYRDMLKESGGAILGAMVSFLVILFVGYLYALKKRAFDWRS